MELNQEKIESAIVREAANKIISDDALYERVKKDIDARVDRLFASRVDAEITAAIDDAIKAGFDREYTKRDSFGRATSHPTTISKELERMIGGYWSQRVDGAGKPTDSTYTTTHTRAEWLMGKMCAADFEKEMKQHVVNVGGALKDHLRAELGRTVNSLLSEVFKVNSLGDREEEAAARKKAQMARTGSACIDPPSKPLGAA